MPWPAGQPAAKKLKDELQSFINTKLAAAPYKARLPRGFVKAVVDKPGKRNGGVVVLLRTEADEGQPHRYHDGTGQVMEEFHRVGMAVQGDERAGAMEAQEAVYSVLKSLFTNPTILAELIALGICDVRESSEGMDFGDDTESSRVLTLTCNTDVYL
jgi:hypothetical protein